MDRIRAQLKQRCREEKERILKLKNYQVKVCIDCGEKWPAHPNSKGQRCCNCRWEHRRRWRHKYDGTGTDPLPGFPSRKKFETMAEVLLYLDHEEIQCLICGRSYRGLYRHLLRGHEVAVDEYKQKYGIPRCLGLVGTYTSELLSEYSTQRMMELSPEEYDDRIIKLRAGRKTYQLSEHEKVRFVPATRKARGESTSRGIARSSKHISKIKGESEAVCTQCGVIIVVPTIAAITHECRLICKDCKKERLKDAQQKWVERNPGRSKEYHRAHYELGKGNTKSMEAYIKKYPNGWSSRRKSKYWPASVVAKSELKEE